MSIQIFIFRPVKLSCPLNTTEVRQSEQLAQAKVESSTNGNFRRDEWNCEHDDKKNRDFAHFTFVLPQRMY